MPNFQRWAIALFKAIAVIIVLLVIAISAFLHTAPFGDNPNQRTVVRSMHYQNGEFVNLIPTTISTPSSKPPSLWGLLLPALGKNPTAPLPSFELDTMRLGNGDFVWLGHSSILMRIADLTVLSDPVFYRASPVPGIGEPFALQHTPRTEALPARIDIVLISHDHYDHLDHRSIQDIAPRTQHFMVPLGVGAHLRKWGVPDEKIKEFDWYESHRYGPLKISLTPARHFSGRGLFNRNATLWGSWVVASAAKKIYFSGDGGYGPHFAEIGARYGPFDIAFVENGAYSTEWNQIHLMPEQLVGVARDLRAKAVFPIHWGKFDLAYHPWDEPIRRAEAAFSDESSVQLLSAPIGKVLSDETPGDRWWTLFPSDA